MVKSMTALISWTPKLFHNRRYQCGKPMDGCSIGIFQYRCSVHGRGTMVAPFPSASRYRLFEFGVAGQGWFVGWLWGDGG